MDSLNPDIFKNRSKYSRLSQEHLNEIKRALDDLNMSAQEISTITGVAEKTIINRQKTNSWIAKPLGRKLKYNFNEHYFDDIDNEHKAYWLGFLMADGYILNRQKRTLNEQQSFGFSISMEDKELFEYFKKDLNADHPVNVYKRKGFCKEEREMGRILLTSQYTVDKLSLYGIVSQKTFKCTFPKIQEDLKPHFIRGYSDGDGSISKDKNNRLCWGICGTKELLSSINDYFGFNYKLSQRWPDRKNNNWALHISGWTNVPNALNICYKNATIFLQRKYLKYREIWGIYSTR